MSTTPLAIETSDLVKTFGDTRAVDGVDLAVRSGSVYGVLGPNGAGKTTTIRMLATLLRPDSGAGPRQALRLEPASQLPSTWGTEVVKWAPPTWVWPPAAAQTEHDGTPNNPCESYQPINGCHGPEWNPGFGEPCYGQPGNSPRVPRPLDRWTGSCTHRATLLGSVLGWRGRCAAPAHIRPGDMPATSASLATIRRWR